MNLSRVPPTLRRKFVFLLLEGALDGHWAFIDELLRDEDPSLNNLGSALADILKDFQIAINKLEEGVDW